MKNVLIIDGQGGKIGALLVERLRAELPQAHLTAVGTNSIATAAMLRAGAHVGATGENPVAVNARRADIILGPVGILAADSLAGEVTPAMALAVGQSEAEKVLLPVNRCSIYVVGVSDCPVAELIDAAVRRVAAVLREG